MFKGLGYTLLCTGFMLAVISSALAEPSITKISTPTSMVNGASVTVMGSGFGTKAQAAPLKWDNFENGAVGNDLANGWYVRSVGAGGPLPKYANDVQRGGKSLISVKHDYTYASGGNRTYGNYFGLTNATTPKAPSKKVYLSFWKYITTSGSACRNFKPFALRAGAPGAWENPEFRHDIYPKTTSGHLYGGDCPSGSLTGEVGNKEQNTYHMPLGTWNRVEYYIDMGDVNTANASWYYWWDHQLKQSNTGFTMCSLDCSWQNLYINAYFARESTDNDAAAYMWTDDVYIDTTRARVELCDKSTWTTSTHCEIQIPTAWADTSVTVQLNQGSFSSIDSAYLYVVDSNGAVNQNGYAVCPNCPRPPVLH